jgi:hypothetical protein
MGVNAIVIIENSKRITRRAFVAGMEEDAWGRYLVPHWRNFPAMRSWGSFKWQGRRYFTLHSKPRYRWLGLAGFNANGEPGPLPDTRAYTSADKESPADNQKHSDIDPENPHHLTFLKAMLAAERLAGGPIMVDNDVVGASSPGETYPKESFYLPIDLDWQLAGWRDAEAYPVAQPGLVFGARPLS